MNGASRSALQVGEDGRTDAKSRAELGEIAKCMAGGNIPSFKRAESFGMAAILQSRLFFG